LGDPLAPTSPVPLIAVALLCGAMGAGYGYFGADPHASLTLGFTVAPFFGAATWIEADARRRGVALVLDWPMLGAAVWPVAVPWYAWRTRGRSGWRLALGLLAVMLAPAIGSLCGGLVRLFQLGAV